MKALLTLLLLLPSLARADASLEAEKQAILHDRNSIPLSIPADLAESLSHSPIGTELPVTDGDNVHIVEFLGTHPQEGGDLIFLFRPVRTIPKAEFDPKGGALGVPGNNSGVGKGEGSGGPGWGTAVGGAAYAAGSAALGAAFVHGVLIPPGDQREYKRVQRELGEAASRTARERSALLEEAVAYETKMAAGLDELLRKAAEYRPLPSPPAPSSFSRTETGAKVERNRARMQAFLPATPTETGLKDISLAAADAAEESHLAGETEDSRAFASTAELFADVALGLNPLMALTKDGYEALTGLHALTDRPLSPVERALSTASFGAGLATMGIASSAVNGLKIAGRLTGKLGTASEAVFRGTRAFAEYGRELGLRSAESWMDLVQYTLRTLGSEIGAVGDVASLRGKIHPGAWIKSYNLHRLRDANLLNADIIRRNPAFRAPYKAGSSVYDLVLREEGKFVRLHNASNQSGRWLVKAEAIDRSLSPADLRLKYSLPFTPDRVSDVTVRPGTLIRRSKVNANFGGGESAVQYEVLDSLDWNRVSFGTPRPLRSP